MPNQDLTIGARARPDADRWDGQSRSHNLCNGCGDRLENDRKTTRIL